MEQEQKVKTRRKKAKKEGDKTLFLEAVKLFSESAKKIPELFRKAVESAEEEEEKGKRAAIVFCSFLGVFAISFVIALAKFPLSVYPGGFALLASLGGWRLDLAGKFEKRERAQLNTAMELTSFSGVLLSSAFLEKNGFFYLLSYLILFLTRAALTGGRLNEGVLARVSFSSAMATFLGLFLSVPASFSVGSVFSALSLGIITPLLTYLLCGFYIASSAMGSSMEETRKRVYPESAFFTAFYLFLYAIREAEAFGLNASFVITVIFTFLLAKRKGPLFGAAAGLVGGLASAGSAVAPALLVAGFFAGLLFETSSYVALTVSFLASLGYSMYAEGLDAFGFFLADYVCAIFLFLPILHFLPKEKPSGALEKAGFEGMENRPVRQAKKHLKKMSDAFFSLSEVFYTVSDTMKKPELSETSRLVSDCCSEICSGCSFSRRCWGENRNASLEATARASAKLLLSGKVKKEDFPPPFSSDCANLDTLIQRINLRFGRMNGDFLKNNKTRLLAGEYSTVSRLLKSTAGELDQETEYNEAMAEKARKVLDSLGIEYRRAAVLGQRELKIDVFGVKPEKMGLSSNRLLSAFEKEFGFSFEAPKFVFLRDHAVLRLVRKRKLNLECAKSGCTKKGEVISGDSSGFFETSRNYFYTLICDGMGSGREAAFTSRLASIFIEKLMHCATPKNVTLEMLNSFLMSKTDETFTTVDLLEIDLYTAEANFIKAGAAPSYVLRNHLLHRIESRTPPAGILKRMVAEQTTFSLCEGDFVILLSDGVEEADGENGWLIRLLSGKRFENASDLCQCIFSEAKALGAAKDDMSVSVVRVVNSK